MLTLRRATTSDQALLEKWDADPDVVASDPEDTWDWARELAYEPEWREQLIAEWSGQPVGMLQIIDPAREETHYWGDVPPGLRAIDIWIGEARWRGRGIGTAMMRAALERCFSDPSVQAVIIDPLVSNTRALRFYERLGFQVVEDRWFEDSYCRVMRVDRPTRPPG